MKSFALSRNGIPIRLTDERWQHIITGHPELINRETDVLNVVSQPELILEGKEGELIAIRQIEKGKWLVVPYREMTSDGFIITTYLTSRWQSLNKKKQLWP